MARISDERPKQALKTDVLVVGGAAAGLAAACTAAKAGAHVLLVEKYGFCGGAAVAGLSGTVCGLFAATDNRAAVPQRLVFGFADRFLDLMKTRGGVTDPVRYGKTLTLTHDPLVWREAGDHLLGEAGAKVLFHSTIVDVLNDGKRKDSIARSAWPIELHSGERPRLEWLLDDYYDIAYDNFVPLKGEGLLVAGRCLSAEHEAMASARVTAQCFSYGQAIGMAAAMCVHGKTPPRALSVSDLRDALRKDGAVI